jgi:hypothetical protein
MLSATTGDSQYGRVPDFVWGGMSGAMSRNKLPSMKIASTGSGQRKAGFHEGSRRILNKPKTQRVE